MIPPLLMIRALAALAALSALAFAWHALKGHYRDEGRAEVQAFWDADKRAQVAAATALDLKYRTQEAAMQASLTAVAEHYTQEATNALAKTDHLRRQLRAGAVRLSIPSDCPAGPAERGDTPEATAIARSGNGGARANLLPEAADFLVGLAGEADAVVRQLTACQNILRAERTTMGASGH